MKNQILPIVLTMAAISLPVFLMLGLNQGTFVYTLDDPYIHMALAENITQGRYGINHGESTAPSSSVIWPFLLVPVAFTPLLELAPLFLNIFFALGTVWLLSLFYRWENLPFTMAAVFAFNLPGLVLTGMEHSLQVLLMASAALGVSQFLRKGEAPKWLYAILFLAPLVRYECLSVSLPVLGFLFYTGYRKEASITLALSLASLAAFSGFLTSLGLDPLPASVFAKSSVVSSSGTIASIARNLVSSLASFRGLAQALLLVPLIFHVARRGANHNSKLLAISAAISVVLHLAFGRFGWFHRYGVYMWVYSTMILFILYRDEIAGFRLPVLMGFLFLSGNYLWSYTNIALASSNIYRQQYQMRLFIHNHLREPVAVNDLGLVSMGYEPYVLDLWGLATPEALVGSSDPLWVDSAAHANRVRFAVVYRDLLPGIRHWDQVARMELHPPLIVCPEGGVDFLCAPWSDPDSLRLLLEDFAPSLPNGIDLVWYQR